jgi:hypothetical protein
MLREDLIAALQEICNEIENLAIENYIYLRALTDTRAVPLIELEKRVSAALLDPEKRVEVRAIYSELWRALDLSRDSRLLEPASGDPISGERDADRKPN